MQSSAALTGSTDAEFEAIPFHQVFHDGPYKGSGGDILRRRCAEVLLPSPLPLRGNLQSVLCRSPAERATLLHLLGGVAAEWRRRVRVYTEPGLFESQYVYLHAVDGGPDGLRFKFKPRRDGGTANTEVWISDQHGAVVLHRGPRELDPGKHWMVRKPLRAGRYLARFEIEGCLAYEAPFVIDELPF